MANFFEKLKRGMGIEVPIEGTTEKIKEEKAKPKKVKKIEIKSVPVAAEPLTGASVTADSASVATSAKEAVLADKKSTEGKMEKWLEPEGQLAVDVYQTELDLVIQSAIAGIRQEDLDISVEGDSITIIGERQKTFEEAGDYFSQECYWGRFSRQLILPVEVDPNKIEATLKNGILTIRIPKLQRERKRKVVVKG